MCPRANPEANYFLGRLYMRRLTRESVPRSCYRFSLLTVVESDSFYFVNDDTRIDEKTRDSDREDNMRLCIQRLTL